MDNIRQLFNEKLTVPLWPTAGKALDLKRGATYRAAASGEIKTIPIGRLKKVPTTWLREKLGLEPAA
jgi:hypothetical protein